MDWGWRGGGAVGWVISAEKLLQKNPTQMGWPNIRIDPVSPWSEWLFFYCANCVSTTVVSFIKCFIIKVYSSFFAPLLLYFNLWETISLLPVTSSLEWFNHEVITPIEGQSPVVFFKNWNILLTFFGSWCCTCAYLSWFKDEGWKYFCRFLIVCFTL